jgi:CheY-like chemotaxis protein
MSSAPKRVLVVDDDADIRETLTLVLEAEGYAVDTACDGLEALAKLRSAGRPELVLLDWKMPRLDGEGFLDAVEADVALRGLNVLVVSAHLQQPPSTRVAGLLRKPLTIESLREAVQAHT